ncbi:type IV pilus biogenesis/stability protein PilW [Alysiella crassa]|uniref:Flp pilus assembly protein TadD, contains TPR repeats n=1 Tax=Alysiella crassa TaxID=153491 RepID=A0A376BWM6_9NEIS|nr:type IV pilus biogenesis/stability protein PilW [Alysiella crassa]UOP06273.1 type IV pilus biogenesis/stability protein PilW [Alysiella crassa]SSY80764.1 Flp pilus assembly protein TadD, contains TPR repeats [Alysiella crassa]
MLNNKWLILFTLSGCLMLGGCVADKKNSSSSTYEPAKLRGQTKKEQREEATRIKTELAVAYMTSGNYRLATKTIDETLKENDKYDLAWLVRAQIYQHLKVYDKAEESFQRALKLNPAGAEINNNYGWFLCGVMNRPNDAIAYFNKAIADPTYPTPEVAYLNKGICHAKMQQFNLADEYFERALRMNEQFIPVFKERARAFLLADNIKEADRLFRQYQSMVDRLNADDLLLGWKIAKHQGLTQAASEYQAQLLTHYPYSDELKAIKSGDFDGEFGNAPTDETE